MNDRHAFLSCIAANPDDDTPRKVYADWLEEQGDAIHAELIRLQCAIAAKSVETERIEWMTIRADQLIKRMPVPPEETFCDVVWDRGFIVSLSIASEFLRTQPWAKYHPIHTVRLSDWRSNEESLTPVWRGLFPWLKRVEIPSAEFGGLNPDHYRLGILSLRASPPTIPGIEVVLY